MPSTTAMMRAPQARPAQGATIARAAVRATTKVLLLALSLLCVRGRRGGAPPPCPQAALLPGTLLLHPVLSMRCCSSPLTSTTIRTRPACYQCRQKWRRILLATRAGAPLWGLQTPPVRPPRAKGRRRRPSSCIAEAPDSERSAVFRLFAAAVHRRAAKWQTNPPRQRTAVVEWLQLLQKRSCLCAYRCCSPLGRPKTSSLHAAAEPRLRDASLWIGGRTVNDAGVCQYRTTSPGRARPANRCCAVANTRRERCRPRA